MPEAGYELFDHTADIGVRAGAPTQAGLVAPCADGLYAVIGDLVTTSDGQPWEFDQRDDDAAFLLRDFLGELLHAFERDRQRLAAIDVTTFADGRLAVRGTMRPIDAERSSFEREVKAVTYHALAVRQTADGFEATYIVDI